MLQSYQSPQDDFHDLDEFLCEYVDGTIDPVVCDALEEYMRMNPRLADHVRELQHTREVLLCYGVRCCKHRKSESNVPKSTDLDMGAREDEQHGYRTFLSFAVIALFSFALLDTSAPPPPFAPLYPPLPIQSSQLSLSQTPSEALVKNNYYSLFTTSNPRPALFGSPSYPFPIHSASLDSFDTHPEAHLYLLAP